MKCGGVGDSQYVCDSKLTQFTTITYVLSEQLQASVERGGCLVQVDGTFILVETRVESSGCASLGFIVV